MALYVAICLIAALTASADVTAIPGHVIGVAAVAIAGLKHALAGH